MCLAGRKRCWCRASGRRLPQRCPLLLSAMRGVLSLVLRPGTASRTLAGFSLRARDIGQIAQHYDILPETVIQNLHRFHEAGGVLDPARLLAASRLPEANRARSACAPSSDLDTFAWRRFTRPCPRRFLTVSCTFCGCIWCAATINEQAQEKCVARIFGRG